MLVSWNWLKEYVALDMEVAEVEHRLAMSGLNHEGTKNVGDDLAIDLEVTSNRFDCLGQIGVAREIAVLWDRNLTVPEATPVESTPSTAETTKVTVECADLCKRYVARVIRGVKVGPSPKWMVDRLNAVGIPSINNVVDVSNYVLFECGQPLHVFDLNRLEGPEIIVRAAKGGELFEAIDHRTYELTPTMCVIADASRAVALGGVMGGADSEVSTKSVDLLIEAAEFAPLSIRGTARKLSLHSPSSYRFERGVDSQNIDWASRRCCQLILKLAGGELAAGAIDVPGVPEPNRTSTVLRLSQLKRILGIDIDTADVWRILTALGNEISGESAGSIEVIPPSWRRDLGREIDLVEEVGRIHGYDKIPEDVGVPMAPSHRRDEDRVMEKVRGALTAAGFDEAITVSVVGDEWSAAFSPWTDVDPIRCGTPMIRGADLLRRSLVPSLLDARRVNESLSNPVIELFETAKVYLPKIGGLPDEEVMVGLASGGDFFQLKGVVQSLAAALNIPGELVAEDTRQDLFDSTESCRLSIGGRTLGFLGRVSPSGLKTFGLRAPTTVAELKFAALMDTAVLMPRHEDLSPYPAISQDLNLIVSERVRWADLADTVRAAGGGLMEGIEYRETYRNAETDGAGKKRLFFSMTFRSSERTLTGDDAERIRNDVVAACRKEHGAVLLG